VTVAILSADAKTFAIGTDDGAAYLGPATARNQPSRAVACRSSALAWLTNSVAINASRAWSS
jgi:uncharacterized protein GlcG (DUF336 family)